MSPAKNTPNDGSEPTPRKRTRKPAAPKVREAESPALEPAQDPIATMTGVLEQTYVDVMRHEPQLRCFERAVRDLGLPVPREWARFNEDGTVSFASMSAKHFRLFINLLEQIVDALPGWDRPPVPQPNDVPLFEVITVDIAAQNNTTSNSFTQDAGAGAGEQ